MLSFVSSHSVFPLVVPYWERVNYIQAGLRSRAVVGTCNRCNGREMSITQPLCVCVCVCVCARARAFMRRNAQAPYSHLGPDPFYNIFPLYTARISKKKLLNIKCVFWTFA